MKKRIVCSMVLTMALVFGTSCSSKETEDVQETGAASTAESITILNIKGEVAPQMKVLADEYKNQTGITVNVLGVDAGVDAQATLKGYYLSDQMPDIIACESAGFGNWEGLLVDMSDQEWAGRTDAAYIDETYGTIGFPYTTEAIGLAYNADILAKAGVDPGSITGPDSMRQAFETIDSKKNELGLKAVIGYCAEPENLGWSCGNHIFGAYLDSGLSRTDTTYLDILNDGGKFDDDRFSDFTRMIALFNEYSDPDILVDGTYDEQVTGFASGEYAFITQGSWIGASLTGDLSDYYSKAGNFEIGMVPYCYQEGMDTILTSAPSWWAVSKEGQVEASLAFLQWCSEDSAQKIFVEQAGFVSPFKDCKYVASDPFAPVISEYISSGKTSSWHWMEMPEGLGQKGFAFAFCDFAKGELDEDGFLQEIKKIASDWYAKL
ncbi:raffinose/stachyose/melibiose transport system substrate-binding protein [Butyrivibrio fibrisolvens]|uniref:Raffinose/stachyose/melibiose transport system substrate-binding protein n=1 Tax=Butyrivibrio fibrisolvens TaxID=831 RepID=A0A1H9SI84_BUTFI|nr:ABC transporter substrate-binding protein [Butyrivibrio fibrisolvens]SER84355.1 raffinose/stachyose/melibiose transport system substrate-binding protein [Butyrivibrio fibrisolvens]